MKINYLTNTLEKYLYTIIVTLCLLILVYPFFIFGPVELYNDDLHFLDSIDQIGVTGGISHWLKEYGLFYRPVSITILYILYFLVGKSPVALYGFSYLCFALFGFLVFNILSKACRSKAIGAVSFIFVTFFVFSSTSFLQNSSSCMNLGAALSILLFSHIYFNKLYIKHTDLAKYSLLWLILCFNYEQVLGISCVFIIVLALKLCSKNSSNWLKTIIKPTLYFGITSSIFLATYLTSQANPKMSSLKKFNATRVHSAKKEINKPDTTTSTHSVVTETKRGRLAGINNKFKKVFAFFQKNYIYSFLKIRDEGPLGSVYLILIFLLSFLLLFQRPELPSLKSSLALFTIGSSWLFFTVAPFLLYKNFNMPPYTLTIPSVGAAMILASIPGFISQLTNLKYGGISLKILCIMLVLIFPISQTGYYFSLKYELKYWNSIADVVSSRVSKTRNKNFKVLNLPDKENEHVFWMKKTIGTRYFATLLPKAFESYKLEYVQADQLYLHSDKNNEVQNIIINKAPRQNRKN